MRIIVIKSLKGQGARNVHGTGKELFKISRDWQRR